MNNMPRGSLEKLTWNQVKNEVIKVNPELANIIDQVSPDDKYWIAKVKYPYGSLVMQKSVLMLPNAEGDIVPITDSSIDPSLQHDLGYNLQSNPVSLILNNCFEIFLPLEDRTIPLSGPIFPGTAFGAWRILNLAKAENPAFIWDMTSGTRSVFMLPKITETKKHMQLRRAFGITADVPRSLMAHWEIFKQIANHSSFKMPWHGEILYFPIQWFQHLDDPQWKIFYNYFQETGWGASEFWRNQPIWNLIFSLILQGYEARPSAYIMDTVKYLWHVGMGALPGLAPAQDDLGGPFSEIQKVYLEHYEIKNYPPVIIQTCMFNMHNDCYSPVYYSLQFPNALEFKPSSRVRTSIISDLHEIRALLMRCKREILSDKFNIDKTSLDNLFRLTQYDYFHNGVNLHAGMRDSTEMPSEDKRLISTIDGKLYDSFPQTSSFVTGCIRLSQKNS